MDHTDLESVEGLRAHLASREDYLRELKAALPAHSIRPHQLIEIEDTEEEIARLRAEVTALTSEDDEQEDQRVTG